MISHEEYLVPAALAAMALPAEAGGETWRSRAACRQVDPDLFFPVGMAGPATEQAAEAKRLCLACTVRRPCLDWALRHGMRYGIWGGTTEDDRAALRRALA
jgi:WhiB family redox-sensing transcriptional regulator